MLRYLDVVAKLGSIRKAAAQLNVASSAINRQIIAFEQEIGEPLFERMPRKMRLTATGELLIQHVRETLKAHDATMRRIEAMRGLKWGSVTLAGSLGLIDGAVAGIIADYLATNPRMSIRVSGAITEAIASAVINGDVNLGLAFGLTPRPGLQTLFAMDLPLGAVVVKGHPLADKVKLRLQNILDYPLAMAEPGMSLRATTDLALSRFSDAPSPVLETNSIGLIRHFLAHSDGVALLNPLDAIDAAASDRLIYLPVDDENLRPQTLRIVCRSRDPIDPIASHFVQHVTTKISELVDGLTTKIETH
jgi:DNA-binding transcriptional LysR family regulator